MSRIPLVLIFWVLLSTTCKAANYHLVTRAEIQVPKPSFQMLVTHSDPTSAPTLLISSFSATGTDHIFGISNLLNAFFSGTASVETVSDKIVWPNEIQHLGAEVLGREGLLVCSGFLVPWKSTGSVRFLDVSGRLTQLTLEKPGYFYHRAIFADVTRTGRQDLITARASIPPGGGGTDGELVWLKRPARPLDEPWEEVVLSKGPDIHFRVFRDSRTQQLFVVSAEFSRQRIALYWIAPDGSVGSRVIDDQIGPVFDLDFYDLNNDGKKELLVTNHVSEATKSGVFAYEQPEDLKVGRWLKHTLLTGIPTLQPGPGQASPGVAKAFVPETALTGLQKPWIVVSGDGSQRLYLLRPRSESPVDWSYDESIALDAHATVGEPVIQDIDHDGFADVVVPAYDSDRVYFMSTVRD